MCLLLFKPKLASINSGLLRNAYEYNPDGWGIFFAEDGKLHIYKGFDLDDLIAVLTSLQDNREIFVHMRMRTHGTINESNLHPFQVTSNIVVAHNGILDINCADKSESDTAAFVRLIQPMLVLNPELIFDQGWLRLVSEFCQGSRLVFLHSSGRYSIIHENDGLTWNGLWMSNTYSWDLWKAGLSRQNEYTADVISQQNFRTYDDFDDFDWDLNENDRAPLPSADLGFLRSLDYEELSEIIWNEPDMVINAIYEN